MIRLFKKFNIFITSFYVNFLIKRNLFMKGFRISNFCEINNPTQISFGTNLNIKSGAIINCQNENHEKSLIIGNNCKFGRDLQINAYGKVQINNDVLIADRVHISDATHFYKKNEAIINQGSGFAGPVIIEDGVWLGINCVILPNVRIGKNSVIGANTVVNKNVPENSIAVGTPMRILKKNED